MGKRVIKETDHPFGDRYSEVRAMMIEAFKMYIASDDWKELKESVWNRDDGICQRCGKELNGKGVVHHEKYQNFGKANREEMNDCILLCGKCHRTEHIKMDKNITPFWANREASATYLFGKINSNTIEESLHRQKFCDQKERDNILQVAKEKAKQDEKAGRKTWIMRWMLTDLAFYTGLRVAEIAALKVKDIFLDFDDPWINVKNGKGGKDRAVYIEGGLPQHLKQFIDWMETGKNDPLFSNKGKHYTTTALHIAFNKVIEAAGARDNLTIHSARHTYAKILYKETKNLRYVQNQLGYYDLNITSEYSNAFN
jgi:hypothetical protein